MSHTPKTELPCKDGRARCRCGFSVPCQNRIVHFCRLPPGKPPSLLQKAKNFAQAAVKHVAAGMPMASDEEIERRFAICQACPFLKDNACTKCGCPVNREKKFISKLSWADQKCPVGHW